jgi:cysteine desulfurase
VADARAAVAGLIGATARELVFTSGATESNNLALKGVADASRDRGNHVVTVQTEHRAVLDPCARLEQQGAEVSYLPVRSDGLLDPLELAAVITSKTVLVTVMMANNEIGVLQPVADLASVAQLRGVPFHTDAAQAAGKVPIDVSADGIDLLSLTAHKLYGPKGVGALFVRRGSRVTPIMDGGGHESGLRSGTLNVPAIVGFGRAAMLCTDEMVAEGTRLSRLRDRLWTGLQRSLSGVTVNGSMTARLPQSLNISVSGVNGEQLLLGLDEVAVSSGAACTSVHQEPSHVLRALGLGDAAVRASIRFGLGRFNTEAEVDYVVQKLSSLVTRLRNPVPVFELGDDDGNLPSGWCAESDGEID